MSVDLIQHSKQRIITDVIRNLHQSCGYLILVGDSYALRILTACCSMSELLQEGVTVVEQLEKPRQPLPQLDVIYLISPTAQSVEYIINDFSSPSKAQYKNAHIFFTNSIDNTGILDQLSNYPAVVSKILSFIELNLDFIAYERKIFHFNMSQGFLDMLNYENRKQNYIDMVTHKLQSVLLSLQVDVPTVRYFNNTNQMAKDMAFAFTGELHNYQRKLLMVSNPSITSSPSMPFSTAPVTLGAAQSTLYNLSGVDERRGDERRGDKRKRRKLRKATVLFLDRSIDIASLFLYDWTYKSAVYDLVQVPVCELPGKWRRMPPLIFDDKKPSQVEAATARRAELTATYQSGNGTTKLSSIATKKGGNGNTPGGIDIAQSRQSYYLSDGNIGSNEDTLEYIYVANKQEKWRMVSFDEKDKNWVTWRYEHLEECNKKVHEKVKNLIALSTNSKIQRGENVNMKETNEAIRELSKYQEELKFISTHVSVCNHCFDIMEKRKLNMISEYLLMICTGVNRNGAAVLLKNLIALFSHVANFGEPIDIIRFCILYFTFLSAKTEERNILLRGIKCQPETIGIVEKFLSLQLFGSGLEVDSPFAVGVTGVTGTSPVASGGSGEMVYKVGKEMVEYYRGLCQKGKNGLDWYETKVSQVIRKFLGDVAYCQKYLPVVPWEGEMGEMSEAGDRGEREAASAPVTTSPSIHGAIKKNMPAIISNLWKENNPPPSVMGGKKAANPQGKNVFSGEEDWTFNSGLDSTTERENQISGTMEDEKPLLLVFIAGGMTMSEMKSAYTFYPQRNSTGQETYENNPYDIIIGSSGILTSHHMINLMKMYQPPTE